MCTLRSPHRSSSPIAMQASASSSCSVHANSQSAYHTKIYIPSLHAVITPVCYASSDATPCSQGAVQQPPSKVVYTSRSSLSIDLAISFFFFFNDHPSHLEKSRYITGIRNVQHPTTNTAMVLAGLSYVDLPLDLPTFLSLPAGVKLSPSSSEESEISEFSCIRAFSSNSFSRSSSSTCASFSSPRDCLISDIPSSPSWFS